MVWYGIAIVASLLFDILQLVRMSVEEKDLEILLLKQQLMIVCRKQKRGPNITRIEKMMLMTVCVRLSKVKGFTRAFVAEHILIFKPDTILRWHRELVRKKWVYDNQKKHGGRPPLSAEGRTVFVGGVN